MQSDDAKTKTNAKAKAGASDTARSGRALAFIPVLVGLTFAALLLPRSAPPDAIPLPTVDTLAFERQVGIDHDLAERARRSGLPDDVRLLGSALREFHALEGNVTLGTDVSLARRAIDDALGSALGTGGAEALLGLRAVQLETFLDEARGFERTGTETPELHAVAGAFVSRLTAEGWCRGHALLPSEGERRVMFKQMWNTLLSLEERPEFAPTLDEMRVLYAFYLVHPHPADAARDALAAARRGARDKQACDALDAGERLATETWRLERIRKLAAIDPAYPALYAVGVAHFRRGNYTASVEAFSDWLREHPTGPFALRARNHLKAAVEADRSAM